MTSYANCPCPYFATHSWWTSHWQNKKFKFQNKFYEINVTTVTFAVTWRLINPKPFLLFIFVYGKLTLGCSSLPYLQNRDIYGMFAWRGAKFMFQFPDWYMHMAQEAWNVEFTSHFCRNGILSPLANSTRAESYRRHPLMSYILILNHCHVASRWNTSAGFNSNIVYFNRYTYS